MSGSDDDAPLVDAAVGGKRGRNAEDEGEHLGPALVAGVGILLYKVSVFTPTDAPVTGRRKSYLNITPRNVRRVFVTEEQSIDSTAENPINLFNKEKEVESQQESDNDDYDDNQASRSEQATRQLLQHSTVRDTSAELTFLSQRQVIHRNPPVRVDPEVATTTKKKGQRGKNAANSNDQGEATGLGRWQWSKLLKKNSDGDTDTSAADSSRSQERQGFLDASSRLVSLITKQNSRNRYDELATKTKLSSMIKVLSAYIIVLLDNPNQAIEMHHHSPPSQRKLPVCDSRQEPSEETKANNSDDDEDDDW
ncbi:unnamed protein product [Phytophthora lilii]|uniref:Unnamed protein product n=1 Tax=Phytophthora lilii TaxID=2077276 RepID=A0A9W6TZ12_9STRA|nr:unnamed protein product [Phytophthora lilii]